MSKPALKPLALLLLAIAAFYWKIIFTTQFSLLTNFETVSQAYAWFHFWADSVRNGVVPLWDPYMFAGRSFPGEMQTAAFYPLHLVFALFPPDRNGLLAPALYHLYFVFAHLLAAWFMFALIRELGLSRFSALLAGVCFSLGGLVGRVLWPHILESALWLPLLFLFWLRAMHAGTNRRAGLYAALTGLTLGMSILAGGLHVVMMQAIVLVIAACYSAFRTGAAHRRRPLVVTAAALAVGLAAGAVQILPSIEYSARAIRFVTGGSLPANQKIPYSNLQDYAFAQTLVSYLLYPAFEDRPGPLAPGSGEVFNPYLGVFPLLLAVIGVWKRRDNPWVRYAAGLAVASFLFSLGIFSLLYGLIYALVPFLWMAREASRFLYMAHFGLVILLAFGAEALFENAQPAENWAGVKRVTGWFAVAAMLALLAPAIHRSAVLRPRTALALTLIVITYFLFRFVTAGARATWARFLAVAFILFDLSAFDTSAENRAEAARNDSDHLERLVSMRGATEFLKSQPGLFRVQVLADPPLNPGDAFGLQTLNGGAVTLATNFSVLTKDAAAADLLNVRYFLKPASTSDPSPVYADSKWKVYENPDARPRAWIEGASGDARVENYTSHRIELITRTAGAGTLVLSEMCYPGWTARVDGRAERISEVYGGLRGIAVPGGESRVVLEYAPLPVRVGGIISATAFLGTLLAWVFHRRAAL